MAIVAHRNRRGPDFLIHDSHLYDGVEGRQTALAFQLAAEICDEEGLQYIVTINFDDLKKAEDALTPGPGFTYHRAAELTDEYDDGGLFGMRFS